MRIILEGCDKCGKSTLASYLRKKLGMRIVKFSAPKGDAFKEYKKAMNELNRDVICDRFWVGENVYGPIYRGKGLTEKQTKYLDKRSRENGDLIIFCNTDKFVIAENFKKDKEEFTKVEDIGKIQDSFVETLSGLSTDIISYDYRLQNMETIYKIVKNKLLVLGFNYNGNKV